MIISAAHRRSNMNDNRTRKTARYSSQNVLSGLLVCGDYGGTIGGVPGCPVQKGLCFV